MRISDWCSDVCSSDLSPLAGEPLAEVFLRLLALPVARFGLVETLDLLASPPLAEAANLDAAAFARLHAWLHRSEARRVGKECVRTCNSRWWPQHAKKNHKKTKS